MFTTATALPVLVLFRNVEEPGFFAEAIGQEDTAHGTSLVTLRLEDGTTTQVDTFHMIVMSGAGEL